MATCTPQDSKIRVKRGETFLLECQVKGADGVAINLTGWAIASEIRTSRDTLVATLTAVIHTPASGLYRLTHADTTEWPPGQALMDIAYTDAGGRAITTETLTISVDREVTQR